MKLPIISLILPRGIYITFPPPGGGKDTKNEDGKIDKKMKRGKRKKGKKGKKEKRKKAVFLMNYIYTRASEVQLICTYNY